MDRQKVYVVSHGSQWEVQCDHCNTAITSTQTEAIQIAKDHVARLGHGVLSQILVQRDDGKFRTEWTYGKDPFPPPG